MNAKKTSINYLYFGTLFVILMLIASSSIFIRENFNGSKVFFFFHAFGQVLLEIFLLIFLASLIRKYLGRFCFALFIGATFFALILHVVDFLMDRILDLSFWEVLRVFVLDESWENFRFLLDASGIPTWTWLVICAVLISIPFLGCIIYKLSNTIAKKKPLSLRNALFLQTFLCIPCALLFFDFSASNILHPDAYTAFIKSLPWKFTLLHPRSLTVSIPGPLHEPRTENSIQTAIQEDKTALAAKPNIYLFVIETLREDCMTKEIAPHLFQFKNSYAHFETALSNGNGSHLSWFSIFHSQFPFHWNYLQKNWQMGSPALNLLKKWGYQIRLYSSAQLGYYGMEELLFGKKLHLLDQVQNFHHLSPVSAADTDMAALTKLQQDIAENPHLQQGQLFIVFWDCTHFDYSWPKDWRPKFTPFAREMAYFKAFQSPKSIEQIKNRYNNSINYMDSLFGNFLTTLVRREEAIVVITGDHGEEFFEHGHLFHNSHLTKEQTHIPIYFKLGNNQRPLFTKNLISQMDIFPTILDHLSGAPVTFLEGNSIFQNSGWPYVVTSRFNGSQTPYEFAIHNGENKLIAQFSNRKCISQSTALQILSLRTSKDEMIPEYKTCLSEWVESEFGPAFNRLFGKP